MQAGCCSISLLEDITARLRFPSNHLSCFNIQSNNNGVFPRILYKQNINTITISFLKIHYIYNHHVEKYRTNSWTITMFHFGVIH